MRNASQMLPLQVIIFLVSMSMVLSPSLGAVTEDKCKCLMCICDVDPHPLPPALPSHHPPPPEPEYYPPPSEPEPTPECSPPPSEPEYYPPPSEPGPTPEYYPPPSEPEPTPEYYVPPPAEPEPTPEYYVPPPLEPYEYPWGETYGPPAPVLGIVGTPGQMYPRDNAFNPSSAHRRLRRGISSSVVAFSIVAGVLSLLMRGA